MSFQQRSNPTACPDCGDTQIRLRGSIPKANIFAGRKLTPPYLVSALYHCENCALEFRFPTMDESQMWTLYAEGAPENWRAPSGERRDWQLLNEWLAKLPVVDRVLEVGSYDGAFLARLRERYPGVKLFGIEANTAAAARARDLGVEIVGSDFNEPLAMDAPVDVVVAFDVFEHAVRPRRLLAEMASLLSEGGYIFVGTGTTDSLTFKMMGSKYWYCHLAEHVSFVSRDWAARAGNSVGLEFIGCTRYSHVGATLSFKTRVYDAVTNALYRCSPSLFSTLRRLGIGGIDVRSDPELMRAPPYWLSAADHGMFVFRKTDAGQGAYVGADF